MPGSGTIPLAAYGMTSCSCGGCWLPESQTARTTMKGQHLLLKNSRTGKLAARMSRRSSPCPASWWAGHRSAMPLWRFWTVCIRCTKQGKGYSCHRCLRVSSLRSMLWPSQATPPAKRMATTLWTYFQDCWPPQTASAGHIQPTRLVCGPLPTPDMLRSRALNPQQGRQTQRLQTSDCRPRPLTALVWREARDPATVLGGQQRIA